MWGGGKRGPYDASLHLCCKDYPAHALVPYVDPSTVPGPAGPYVDPPPLNVWAPMCQPCAPLAPDGPRGAYHLPNLAHGGPAFLVHSGTQASGSALPPPCTAGGPPASSAASASASLVDRVAELTLEVKTLTARVNDLEQELQSGWRVDKKDFRDD